MASVRLALRWLLATGLGLGAIPVGGAAAQVSPGPLAQVHRELEGTLKCTSCHAAGKAAMDARCTTCHREVGWLAERGRGFHGRANTKATPCASCHPDHAGEDFALIKWPGGSPERFDHASAGFALRQSHATLDCDDCHTTKHRVSPAARLAPAPGAKWTGLEQSCASCHADPHRGALGEDCTSCHDAGAWKTTPGFDHDTTGYPLTGRHRSAGCDDCHATSRLASKRDASGAPVPVFRPVPHQSCASCHRDVHEGKLGAGCADCHSTEGFERISGGGFDHSRTGYPLRGKHAAVRCAQCHGDFSGARRAPAYQTCGGCHDPDPHRGTATLAGTAVDCAACHSERGFMPSTLPRERHQRTGYPLDGKHLAVTCSGCHRSDRREATTATWGSAGVVLRPEAGRCVDCHLDQHGGQLSGRSGGGECGACHRTAGWAPSTFERAAHDTLALALDGRHGQIACSACHGAIRSGLPAWTRDLGEAGFAFAGLSADCTSCHLDPHAGRFVVTGERPVATGCLGCHGTDRFSPSRVDVVAHARFRFPLEGAHRATPCSGCHRDLLPTATRPDPPASTLVASGARLAALPLTAPGSCEECHRTPHGPQFDGRNGGDRCEACHDVAAFAPAGRFDHGRDASFELEGAHLAASCGACHRPAAPGGPILYRPLSPKCESCHTRSR